MLSSPRLYFRKPGLASKANFFRLLAIAQEVGVGIRDSLIMLKHTENNTMMRNALTEMIQELSAGKSLHDAMEQHPLIFSTSALALVSAGESMGHLSLVLGDIARDMEEQYHIQQKLQSALTYPSILIVFSIVAVAILLVYVVPTIVGLFPSMEDLPSITRWMIYISDIVRTMWIGGIILLTGISMASYRAYTHVSGVRMYIDRLLITLPFLRHIYTSLYCYKFCKILGDFSSAGVGITETFKQMHTIFHNYHYKKKAYMIQQDITSGFSITEAIEGSYLLFDPLLIQTVAIGEETGRMDKVMLTLAQYYREQLRTHIQNFLKIIEPVLMVCVAIVIGSIIASIFLPLADLASVIGA